MSDKQPFDLIIVGASAAGVAAAIYAARRKLTFIVLSLDIGGEVATSGEIENYPGYVHTDGIELAKKFEEQLTHNNVDVRWPTTVKNIVKHDALFTVDAEGLKGPETYRSKTVIISSGMHPRKLGVPGETELRGKGVTYCTTCDGPLFKGKPVITIGGGNSALESALMMADLSPQVTVINKNPQFKGDAVLIDKLRATKNITVIAEAKTTKILGEQLVSGAEYTDTAGKTQTVEGKGIFIHIGNLPNSDFTDAEKSPRNAIITDRKQMTNTPGLFAAGDVTETPFWQIGIAVGQGITAVLAAIEYLNRV
ncbi:MAG: FAD-dependent oxidoreductase [Candidatus Kerfeldbacteria bacterium]|nr:FAD-dependent oxidoreductase [Candidatus Kerfeldbacteria bacterium]